MHPVRHVRPSVTLVVATVAAATTLAPDVAQAQYLDPGAGSILVQAIIAVVVGLAATTKLYWHRISGLFGRRKDRGES